MITEEAASRIMGPETCPRGDHIIFIGHVERYAYTNRPTLLFCRGKYMRGEPLLPP